MVAFVAYLPQRPINSENAPPVFRADVVGTNCRQQIGVRRGVFDAAVKHDAWYCTESQDAATVLQYNDNDMIGCFYFRSESKLRGFCNAVLTLHENAGLHLLRSDQLEVQHEAVSVRSVVVM